MAKQWSIAPKVYERYEDVLNAPQVDAVELLTPTPFHTAQVLAALDAGKHVSCQKPHATTVADADRVTAAAASAKTRTRVMENFLFYPPLMKAKELLDDGVIGEPSLVRFRGIVGDHESEKTMMPLATGAMDWRRDTRANPGGQLYDAAWHKYATAMWWIGDVESVSGVITRGDDPYMESPAVVTWKFKGRDCLAVFEYAHTSRMSFRGRYYPVEDFFEIYGTRGNGSPVAPARCSTCRRSSSTAVASPPATRSPTTGSRGSTARRTTSSTR